MVSCSKCGYALYRTSTRSSARKIHYYRCLGSDAWRHLNGPVCSNRPVRQDLLDQVVWTEIVKLLEAPRLIDDELNRRLEAAQNAAPTKRRQEALQRDLARVRKSMERLMTAFQEGSRFTRGTAQSDAGFASTRTGRTCRVAINCNPSARSRFLFAVGRDARGISRPLTLLGRDT
jgi:hypothetical protein